MIQDQVLKIFRDAGALLEGHFELTSGLHSGQYLEKFNVLQHPEYTEKLCAEIAGRFAKDRIEVVIGPVTGGIILSFEVARHLGKGVRSLFMERENNRMVLRRGFSIAPGERVLIVEDIVTTGGSVMEVIRGVKESGGNIVGIGLLVDRSGGKADFGFRTEALASLDIQTYQPEKCPICRQGIPLKTRGSRKLQNCNNTLI